MATGMREKTTNVGGIIKRIWYAMTGATQGAELMSIDDAGKFKCVNEQITGLAGTGNRMVVADSTGNLSAGGINTYTPFLSFNAGQVGGFTQVGFGSYVITGNMVKVLFKIAVSAIPSAGTFLCISLPIPRKGTLCGSFSRYNGINVSTTANFIGLSEYGSDLSNAWIIKSKNDGTGGLNGVHINEINTGIFMQGVIEYEI